jgi:hypothetical protein
MPAPAAPAPRASPDEAPAAADAASPEAAPPEIATAAAPPSAAADEEPSPAPVEEPPRRPATAEEQRAMRERFAALSAPRGNAAAGAWPTTAFRGKDGREYRAEFRVRQATGDSLDLDHVLVDISTEDGGNRLTTQLRLKRLSFSSYAQFVDRWDPEVQIHDDVIDGRFHSNSAIRVRYSAFAKPTFHGLVTTSARDVTTDGIGRLDEDGMFRGGLETGVQRIALPRDFTPLVAASARVEHVEGEVFLTFYPDGAYGIRLGERTAAERQDNIGAGALYVLGADEDTDVHLRGTLRGRVLVYTPGRIVIEDDVAYVDYPSLAPDARDFLGLVADTAVEIAGPDVTGPGDLLVTASIYARRQFAVRSFRSRSSGTLRIFGSVAAGSITATEPRFATDIRWDERLETMKPPGFPQTDRYELDAWDGEWRLEPADAAASADSLARDD